VIDGRLNPPGRSMAHLAAALVAVTLVSTPASAQGETVLQQAVQSYEAGQYSQARSELLPLAEAGNADASFLLGDISARGLGRPQNFVEAAGYYQQGAEQGHPASLNALGRAHVEGLGVNQDAALAIQYLQQAAQSGEADFVFDYARALEAGLAGSDRISDAADLYQVAASGGHAEAAANLGLLYMEGRGVERSLPVAMEYLEQAANAGDARAANNLGLIFVRGEDIERDYARALGYFQAAAEQGLSQAYVNLSVMYENGFGVDFNEAEAQRLLAMARGIDSFDQILENVGLPFDPRLIEPDWQAGAPRDSEPAALSGDPVALYITGYYKLVAPRSVADRNLGLERMERAAEAGLSGAQLDLGLLFARGVGVPQDYVTAYFWISLAANNRLPDAALMRNRLAREMTSSQLERAQARVRDHTSLQTD
jgi:TPR repeat protein